tara:strand:+ start:4043 stop:4396 length:354 start_codon:yes stop_codon:yes gene_type:complete
MGYAREGHAVIASTPAEKERKRKKEYFTNKWLVERYLKGKVMISETKLIELKESFPSLFVDKDPPLDQDGKKKVLQLRKGADGMESSSRLERENDAPNMLAGVEREPLPRYTESVDV